MRYLHTIFTILFFVLWMFFSLGINETFANSNYLNQVNEKSSSEKVKKLQEVFKGLWLYSWEVDWNFSSIKEALIDYQVENWIIPSREHYEAWYFWNKTIKSLKEKFWQDFLDLQKEFLVLETPQENQEWYFKVTAYYSPLPGQKSYLTWSYETEIKLNGWWNTASWKKPSTWTIAAPRNYLFWTKIYIEWYWVWVVEDRWWAIVNSWDNWHIHDRLDIWMGYGDEGLQRTKKWWVRTVKWNIVSSDTQTYTTFYNSVDVEPQTSSIEKYKDLYVSPENPISEDVKMLQTLLKETNLYFWEIDWDYSKVKEILIDFQIKNGIISSKNSSEAWYFWNKTYIIFRRLFWEETEVVLQKSIQKTISLTNEEIERINWIKKIFLENLDKKYSWNQTEISAKIEDVKFLLRSNLSKFSGKDYDILTYFIEIL